MKFTVNQKSKKADKRKIGFEPAKYAVAGFSQGSRIVGLTKGQFSLLHLICELVKITGPADIICATWSAGLYDASVMNDMLDSGALTSFLLITDRSYSTRQKQYALSIEQAFGVNRIRTTNLHAKFVLISNDRFKICIRSSMNLNENKRCENFDIDDDKEIFDFYKSFVDEIELHPPGFQASRTVVDPLFNELMGGGVMNDSKSKKRSMRFFDKNGNEI